MHVFQLLMQVFTGGALVWGSAAELVEHLRTRSRLIRTTGVVVGLEDSETRPGVKRRSAVFRFTAGDGRSFETTSSAQTWPGLKVGTSIPVVYDPERPWRAERAGVRVFKLWLMPLTLALGVFLLVLAGRTVL
ncbi:DUF3592 domain-containing protein [Streptomyces globisporus]|uniref:DUF3592 domain-containing protein n=1 Tax=Streptomyces globisporus TaxID=1908 RepID=UPI0004C8BEA2|nr:DUF3592 domain-containing protein [Streptomyces globisporus]